MKQIQYLIISLCLYFAFSCGVGAKLKKADVAYEAGGYNKAAKLYRKAAPRVKDKTLKAEVFYKTAESFRLSGDYTMAGRYYDMAIRNKYNNTEMFLNNAKMALIADDTIKARKQTENYLQLLPNDIKGLNLVESFKLIAAEGKKKGFYKVENVKEFNSKYSDFSPAYGSGDYETVYFTSSRKEGKKKMRVYDVTGHKNTDIFLSEQLKKGWAKPIVADGDVNTEYEEGSCVFAEGYNEMYITRCMKDSGEKHGCAIMVSSFRNGAWSEPKDLKLVPDSMVAAHPALSADGLTLYFSSNLKGGFGGTDLWFCTRSGAGESSWSEPINMGSVINTAGNEMFPTVRRDTLYFSSDGRPGFGGLDIFKAHQTNEKWAISNMGKPINSNADDFGIIYELENERGYFTSGRKGGRGGDDIYSFKADIPVIEHYFSGLVLDAKTKAKINKAEVKLMGSDGSIIKRITAKDGAFKFRLAPDAEYMATVSLQGYFTGKSTKFSTEKLDKSKNFIENISLTSFERPVEIPNIFFQFGKADLSPQSTSSLDQLITVMDDNPKIVVELRAHTDNRGSDEANMVLSQRRAQAVIDYLASKGIDEDRMIASGYGESEPRTVTAEIAARQPFLRAGQILNEAFINTLTDEKQKEECHSLNRRTEILVISDKYETKE